MEVIVSLLWILFFVHGSKTQEAPIGGVSRASYGVDFNFLFQINNMHGTWKHAWTFDLSLLDRVPFKPGRIQCFDMTSPLCEAEIDFLNETFVHFSNFIKNSADKHEWIRDPQVLATLERNTETRTKRALLPFIGDIEHFLFGVATDSELKRLKKTIKDMTNLSATTYKQVTNLGENLASLTQVTESMNENNKKAIESLHESVKNVTEQVNVRMKMFSDYYKLSTSKMDNMEREVVRSWIVQGHILRMLLSLIEVQQADLRILSGIQTVLQGYLPIEWVTPKDLREGLTVAEEGIRRRFPAARLSHSQRALGFYYTHRLVTPIIEMNRITLLVDIPVDLDQQYLSIYAVRRFPVSFLPYNPYRQQNDQGESPQPVPKFGRAVSILDDDIDYFLISRDGKLYSIADHKDIQSCRGDQIKECPKQFALYNIEYPSCLQSIWLDKPFRDILEICPYKLYHTGHAQEHNLFVQVIPLSNGRWYIDAPLDEPWTIVCPQRPPEIRKACTSCVIQVDCGCGIASKWFQIPTRMSACSDVFAPFNHNYTINPFQYQADKTPWIVNLTGSTEFKSPVPEIPNINIPSNENWDDVMESLDSKQYDLNRLYHKQQNETLLYRTEAEALLTKINEQDSILDSLSSWPDWVVTGALILSFVNSGCILLMCYCLIGRGVHAASLTGRFTAEKSIMTRTEGEIMISLDLIILIFVLLIFALQVVMAWPIISQWLMNRKWYRHFRSQIPVVQACGFRKQSGEPMASITGIANFISGQHRRQVLVKIDIASVPAGTHIESLPEFEDTAQVKRLGDVYQVVLTEGCNMVTAGDRRIEVREIFVEAGAIHDTTHVPERYVLLELLKVKFEILRA